MRCVGYICPACRTYHRMRGTVDPCPRRVSVDPSNLCKREFFEVEAEHLPGRPRFRTYGQRDRYFKRHGLVGLGKSDLPHVKRMAERSGGRLPARHDLKTWWAREATKYRGLVNQPALRRS